MAIFQSQDLRGQVYVFVNSQSELSSVYASTQFIKHATVLEDNTKWTLFPNGDTWYALGSSDTIEAAEMPDPVEPSNPFATAIVGRSKVGGASVG